MLPKAFKHDRRWEEVWDYLKWVVVGGRSVGRWMGTHIWMDFCNGFLI